MSGARLLVAIGLGLIIVGSALHRKSPAAQAASPEAVYDYGENTEEMARRRYEENAPRHWRHTMTRR